MPSTARFLSFVAILVLSALLWVGCGDDESSSDGDALSVAANFYPVEEAVARIGGDRVDVTDLTPPGESPHDLELTPEAVAALEDAEAVFYVSQGFQPQVEKAIGSLPETVERVDLLAGLELRPPEVGIPGVRGEVDGGEGEALENGGDPHVWVDPGLFATMVEQVRDTLVEADPDNREEYEANAEAYLAELRELDRSFAEALSECESRVLVTSHAAFGYLTDNYDLIQAPIAGISPEEEPDPASLAALARYAEDEEVTTVYFETLVPRSLSETLAGEIGAETSALNPIEGLTEEELESGDDYVSIQEDNLGRLKEGLECTG